MKCDNEYTLYEGKCLAYSLVAVYKTTYDNQVINLIGIDNYYIDKIIIDNMISQEFPTITIHKKGNLIVYFFTKGHIPSYYNFFQWNNNVISVNFTSHFKLGSIVSFGRIFDSCHSLLSVDFSNLNTSQITDMAYMFYECENLIYVNFRNIDTSNVESMYGMFMFCYSLENVNLGNLNAENARFLSYMFFSCKSLKSVILPYAKKGNKIENMDGMFESCEKLISLNFVNLDISNVKNMETMFRDCYSFEYINVYDPDKIDSENSYLKFFNPQGITSIVAIFAGCINLKSINITNWNFEKVYDISHMLESCISLTNIIGTFDIKNARNIGYFFRGCQSLEKIDLSIFKNTHNVMNMNRMFKLCSSLKEIDFSSFDMTNVVEIDLIFKGCNSLTYVNFNTTSKNKIRSMDYLFLECSSLKSVNFNNFYTGNVVNMKSMFWGCHSITSLNLSSFDTSKVTTMNGMFEDCFNLIYLNIIYFNKTSLIDNNCMFYNTNKSIAIITNPDFYQVINNLNLNITVQN